MLTVIALTLAVVSGVWAMSSPNYQLNWFTPMTSSSGGEASSTNYGANVTIGQTAIGPLASSNYNVSLGYWVGQFSKWLVYLPLTLR